MDWIEFLLTIGIMIIVTVIYILARKFIAWSIEYNQKFRKKQGALGLSKGARDVNKQIAYDKLTGGYAVIMGVLLLYIIKLICDAI